MFPDEGLARLRALRHAVLETFIDRSVAVEDATKNDDPWCPHLTVAKLSKFRTSAMKKKKQEKVRRIEPSWYANFDERVFGESRVTKVQLLAMSGPKDANRYYHCERSCPLDVEFAEEDDHTDCCFPRRPVLHTSEAVLERGLSERSNDAETCASDTTASTEANILVITASSGIATNDISVSADETAHITLEDESVATLDTVTHTNNIASVDETDIVISTGMKECNSTATSDAGVGFSGESAISITESDVGVRDDTGTSGRDIISGK